MSAGPTSVLSPSQRDSGLGRVGVVEWFTLDEHERAEQLIELLRQAGVRHLRTGVSWADCHTARGLDWYEWVLPRLAESFTLLPCVTYTPPSLGHSWSSAAPPRRPRDYADFLDVFVSRFGHLFEWIELWNEPNNLNDWDWRIDHEWHVFSQMIGDAAYWMRRRGKKTVLGGMCPTDPNWLDLMCRRGVIDHIDAVGVHAFPMTWTPHWKGWQQEISEVREVLGRHGADPEIWITEAGYSTWRHDEPDQIGHFLDLLDAPAERVYWYSLQDLHEDKPSQEGFHFDERHYHTGLVRSDGTPKLLLRALNDGGVPQLRSIAALQRRRGPRPRRDVALVTGGAGFIGANLADRLARDGEPVLIYDSLSRPGVLKNLEWLKQRHGDRIEVETADVRDRQRLRRAVHRAGSIFHFAAQVAVTSSLADPLGDFQVNALGTLNLLEAARERAAAPPVVMASTNKLYGLGIPPSQLKELHDRYAPIAPEHRAGVNEDAPIQLVSPYGCSKGAANQYMLDYARMFGVPAAVFRMSCIYGPRQFGTVDQGWVAHFVDATLGDRPITIYGDGKQVRDILFVDDAVEAYILARQHMAAVQGQVYNLGGGPANAVSLLQLLGMIRELHGAMPEVRFDAWRPGDQRHYVSDTRRFRAATAWRPLTAASAGVAILYDWLRGFLGSDLPAMAADERLSA